MGFANYSKWNAVFFKDPSNVGDQIQYTGPLDDYNYMSRWLSDKCIPLVREITFENAEELTEEGVPFLILFRSVGDSTSEKLYSDAVLSELYDQKASINCLMADGKRFAHPLHHLGKSEKDLPLIAIDSFRHMYLFPDFSKLGEKGALRQFVNDLHSGKLHREFHHGPDPTLNQIGSKSPDGTQPPESVFKQLKPSENRYSILNKEEL
uniref:Thioredoxin domain-containing protein n=1 Tax=Ditylenchus dipsaci TaxID=166011 RepID=A0A915EHZ1_9BILA